MVINVSVQCNGGLLPDIILLTLCDSIGEPFLFEGTLVIGLILRSLWGLYKIHETLWFYLVAL